MVVVRGVLVPFSGIWNPVHRCAQGREEKLPTLELRGTVSVPGVACGCCLRIARQPSPKVGPRS